MSSTHSNRINWHILGAGAMGCLWAARLWQWGNADHGLTINLLLRDAAQVENFAHSSGLIMEADNATTNCTAATTCPEFMTDPVELLLLATKAQDAEAALQGIAPFIDSQTRIVLLQNGLRSQQNIAQRYGSERVFILSNSHGAWLRAAFQVVHAGKGETWLGQLDAESKRSREERSEEECIEEERGEEMLQLLPAAAMNIRLDSDITHRLWIKLAINCAINALTVVHDCRNGELLTLPIARQELIALCQEIETIFAAVPEAPAVPGLLAQVDKVLYATAMNYSSMLQDVRHGRQTEIAELNGYLCELAQQINCSHVLNAKLMESVNLPRK